MIELLYALLDRARGSKLFGHYDRALLAAFTPFMGIPYYLGGKISQQYAVEIAELINGALIGVLSYDILRG